MLLSDLGLVPSKWIFQPWPSMTSLFAIAIRSSDAAKSDKEELARLRQGFQPEASVAKAFRGGPYVFSEF